MSTLDDQRAREVRWRFRLVAASLALVAVAFLQEPGLLVADTKLDLAVAPKEFLERALHMWDPDGAFGQLQNQAYGYLFPLGPFFWAGDLVSLPGWVVQRLWWALVLVTAFLGVVRVAGLLGVGSPATRLLAGIAYALSPRMLTTLGPISIEAWPSAVAPWVLVAVIAGTRRGSPRRAAAFAALAVAAVGGVNAAATAAVLPLGVWWLLTREAGPRRRALMLWWPVLTVLATAWWLGPLFLLAAYSPPFLDFIEPAAVTTFPTTLVDALRGTSSWVPYVEPGWRAGSDLISTPFLVLNSGVLLALGVAGLARADCPQRRFLVGAVLIGMALVTLGHLGEVQGWFAAAQRDLLDAALAPLRNVHKFDPMVRLPLVLGLAHAVTQLAEAARPPRGSPAVAGGLSSSGSARWRQAVPSGVLVLGFVAAVGAAGPALAGRVAPAGAFGELPAYWEETAQWLAARDDGTRALLVPGSSFGDYVWGSPRDEPLQPLADARWGVRDAIPLAPAGTIRMLDAVEESLARGRASPGLADYLARAGVGWLVVRNDLEQGRDVLNPVRVHRTLEASPGIRLQAAFGPQVGGLARFDDDSVERLLVESGWHRSYPAVMVYQVGGADPVAATPDPRVVAGGPEDLLGLVDAGVLGRAPAELALDVAEERAPARWVLTDGLRRRERVFGRLHGAESTVLTAEETTERDVPARDYLMPGQERWETVARWDGVEDVRASSSMAQAAAPGETRPDQGPAAAVDGVAATQWVSGVAEKEAWLQVDLGSGRDVSTVGVVAGDALGPERQLLRVVTENGASEVVDLAPREGLDVRVPPGITSWVRVESAGETGAQRLAVRELAIPGVRVRRPLVLPTAPEVWGPPEVVSLSSTAGLRSACVPVRRDLRCAPGRTRPGEESLGLDRVVSLPTKESYSVQAEARPRYGPELLDLIQADRLARIDASSVAVPEAAASAVAAVDGNRRTTWLADVEDGRPTLTLSWVRPQRITGLRFRLDRQAAAAPVTEVVLAHDGGRQRVEVGQRGRAAVRAFRTDRLELRLRSDLVARGLNSDGTITDFGVGVSELRVRGTDSFPQLLSTQTERRSCGTGPDLVVNQATTRTAVVTDDLSLFLGRPAPLSLCGRSSTVSLAAGENRVLLARSPAFTGHRLLLGSLAPAAVKQPRAASPSPVLRRVSDLDVGGGLLTLRENVNDGWQARGVASQGDGDETALEPRVVDGWQQGWQLPVGVDQVVADYTPDRWYRLSVGVGAFLVLLVALVAAWPARRPVPSSLSESPRAELVLGAVGVAALLLLAGWWGLAAATGVAVSAVVRRWRSWDLSEEAWMGTAAAPVAAAALVAWWRPWADDGGWAGELAAPQLLVLLSLALLLGRSWGTRQVRSRLTGSSTTR